jgi:hypothetical protein
MTRNFTGEVIPGKISNSVKMLHKYNEDVAKKERQASFQQKIDKALVNRLKKTMHETS